MNTKSPTVTVLSMCYNKADTIMRCYDSLRNQTCYDFEWIIVNDGSTDNILELLPLFKNDLFPIHFIDKKNEGISPTWNRGVQHTKGKVIFRVDPDDWTYPQAIEKIVRYYPLLEDDNKLCGVVFQSTFEDGECVGYHPFSNKITRCDFSTFRVVHHAVGDRAEVCLTSVFKEFPWPNYSNEKFYPESVMWNNIANKYDALYVNEPIYIREYGDNCISANNSAVMRQNPKGYMDGAISQIQTIMKYPPHSFKRALRCSKIACNYFRYGMYSKDISCIGMIKRLPAYYQRFTFPVGACMHILDRYFPSLIHWIVTKLSGRKSILKKNRKKLTNELRC